MGDQMMTSPRRCVIWLVPITHARTATKLCRAVACRLSPDNTGLRIDISHDVRAPACSNKRFRSISPIGRAANWDQRTNMPDRRLPETPHGPGFASRAAPAGPNAHKSPEVAGPQQPATHNDAPLGRSSGSHRARNRRSDRSRLPSIFDCGGSRNETRKCVLILRYSDRQRLGMKPLTPVCQGPGFKVVPAERAQHKVPPAGVRIESDSSLEVEPPVLIQIEFAIEPRRGIEPLHLLRSVKRPHPPGVGIWPVNPPTREPIVKRG
jgi:hypothetical protein